MPGRIKDMTLLHNIKLKIAQKWNLVRILRLVIGTYLTAMAVTEQEWLFFPIGLILLWQSIMNTGCLGSNQCSIQNHEKNKKINN